VLFLDDGLAARSDPESNGIGFDGELFPTEVQKADEEGSDGEGDDWRVKGEQKESASRFKSQSKIDSKTDTHKVE
jgi:hypothetical protein